MRVDKEVIYMLKVLVLIAAVVAYVVLIIGCVLIIDTLMLLAAKHGPEVKVKVQAYRMTRQATRYLKQIAA